MAAGVATLGPGRVLADNQDTYTRWAFLSDTHIAADPDNHLARAYMGLALIAAGRVHEAEAELREIRARGGRGGWPDRALSRGLAAGAAIGY